MKDLKPELQDNNGFGLDDDNIYPDDDIEMSFDKVIQKKLAQKQVKFHQIDKDKKAKFTQKIIEKKQTGESILKPVTSKEKRIKRRTLRMVQVDKYKVRDYVRALRAFHFQNKGEKDGFLKVQVILSKKLAKVTIKPILL